MYFHGGAQLQVYANGPERSNRFADFVFGPLICGSHLRTACSAKERSGHTRSGQPHDSTRLPRNSNGFALMPQNPLARMLRYLNFNVVSANSAKTSAAIQNRTITFDSLQPSSSKW